MLESNLNPFPKKEEEFNGYKTQTGELFMISSSKNGIKTFAHNNKLI